MAWPTSSISTTNLLDGTKNPSLARADLLLLTQAVNDIIASRGAAGGIAAIGSDGTVATSQLSPSAVLSAIVGVSGAGSLLDADLLDGLQGSAYATLDGLRDFSTSGNNAVNVRHTSAATSTIYEGLRVYHDTSNTPVAGFGAAIGWRGSAAGGSAKMGDIAYAWTDPTVLSVDSKVLIRTMNAGALEDALVCNAGYLELRQISSPAGDAASGRTWIYAKSDGLYVKRPGVAELLLGAGGGGGITDHGGLSGLSDDDHSQYLLTTGARALTGVISFATYAPSYDELGGNPTGPGTGKWSLFFKSDGAYTITGTNTVVGPLGVGGGGVTDHGALTGLADDDHTQYLLRQPATDYVLNEAGSDYDFRIEGVGAANLFNLDAGADQVTINGTAASNSSCRFAAIGSSGGAIFAKANGGPCFKADSYTAGATGLLVTTTHASAAGADISTATSSRSNYLLNVADTSASAGQLALVRIAETNATASHKLLKIEHYPDNAWREVLSVSGGGVLVNGGTMPDCTLVMYANDQVAFDLFHATSTDNQVGIGTAPAAGTARLQVQANTDIPLALKVSAVTTQAGVLSTTSSGTSIEAQASTGTAIKGGVTATAGTAAYLYRTVASAGGGPVLKAEITHASDNGAVAQLKTAGTGDLLACLTAGVTKAKIGNGGELTLVQRTEASAPASSYWTLWPQQDTGWWTRTSSGSSRNLVSVVPAARSGHIITYDGAAYQADNNWIHESAVSSGTYTSKTLLYADNVLSANISFGCYVTTKEVSASGASFATCSVGPGLIVGAFVKVTADMTAATKFHLGTADDPTLLLADVSTAINTKTDSSHFRPRPCVYLPTSTSIVVTSADAAFSDGSVHVVIHWIGARYN